MSAASFQEDKEPGSGSTLLEIRRLGKYFPVKKGIFAKVENWVKAVDDISFSVGIGETFGLVGESGCGKTTTAKLILLIETPSAGSIVFKGRNAADFSDSQLKDYRAAVQAVFQDPGGSLSPRLRVRNIISEPITAGRRVSKAEVNARVAEVLQLVSLRREHGGLFPHQFSGGQRQRIAIARALSTNPRLIILDEPISSLDVSIRAQVMNLLVDLQQKLGLSYLLIAHDLAVVLHMSSRVGVMYAGKMVESAPSTELYEHPAHPYTKALFAAAFHQFADGSSEKVILPGEVASLLNPPPGCRFHPRCPSCMPVCREIVPELKDIAPGHQVACHLF